jgi:PP-loop superfamily ATP-utilizing enzyme
MEKILYSKDEISAKLREIGIPYASLDLLGYRSGSMDERVK